MPNTNNKINPFQKFSRFSAKKQAIIALAIFLITVFIVSASAFAYQVYLENNQTNQNYPSDCQGTYCERKIRIDKPNIYLYPTKTEDVKVKLEFDGELTSTYPKYNDSIGGWDVTAFPDGHLVNKSDGREYSYIFWEGASNKTLSDFNTGFVVKESDTKDFLQASLERLGLTPKEYNEMIVYWLPKMEHNKYNLIHFAGKEYTDTAKLTVTPTPDSMLRVFMVFKPIDKPQIITTQQLPTFERKGFTVIEWGGTEIY